MFGGVPAVGAPGYEGLTDMQKTVKALVLAGAGVGLVAGSVSPAVAASTGATGTHKNVQIAKVWGTKPGKDMCWSRLTRDGSVIGPFTTSASEASRSKARTIGKFFISSHFGRREKNLKTRQRPKPLRRQNSGVNSDFSGKHLWPTLRV